MRVHTIILLSTILGLSVPTTASAGHITRNTAASDFEWTSTECRKPIQSLSPALTKQQKLQQYANDITAYIACLQREAQRDFEVAQTQMQAAIEAELKAETDRMDAMIVRAYKTTR